MAWVAFDRAVKLAEEFRLEGPIARWKALRQEIHDDVCSKAFNASRGAFTQHYGADALDASVLLMPLVGFLPASDPRMCGTVAAIERELMADGFVMRYDTRKGKDGLPPGEGVVLGLQLLVRQQPVAARPPRRGATTVRAPVRAMQRRRAVGGGVRSARQASRRQLSAGVLAYFPDQYRPQPGACRKFAEPARPPSSAIKTADPFDARSVAATESDGAEKAVTRR